MIAYLTRKEVDVEKYNACIEKAINSRIYAFSWYLDIVTDNWDVLVLNDYEVVMPLPWRRKYFVKYVYLPSWVQQLGVFSKEGDSKDSLLPFFSAIPKKFKFIEMHLNSGNSVQNKNITIRDNYILNLEKPYYQLFKNFNKGRKSDIKKARNQDIKVTETKDLNQLIYLFQLEKEQEVKIKTADYNKLKLLSDKLYRLNKIKILEIYNQQNALLGGAVFLINSKRITYLFSASNIEGRQKKVISLTIDFMIEKYSNTKYIFDFEGSMIPNLASFFKSFGAEKEQYFHYKKIDFGFRL